ncbi:MAG: ferritin family protein, partial [Planctomycetota bacterium]
MDTVVDVIKTAIANEVLAKTFYRSASEIASDGESQMVFLELIDMEAGHAQLLVDRFGGFLAERGVDAAAHLAELEAKIERGLDEEEAALLEEAELGPVVDFAIRMEENARDAYRRLMGEFTDVAMIDLCRELADEEQSHFDMLSKLRTSMDT